MGVPPHWRHGYCLSFSWIGFQLIGTRAEAEVVYHVFCMLTIIMSCLETGGNPTFVWFYRAFFKKAGFFVLSK